MNIKRIHKLILACVAAGGFISPVAAQSTSVQTQESQKSPVEVIENGAQGRIKIDIPDYILELIESMPEDKLKSKTGPVLRPGINRLNGYRIQVFSDGRSSHSLEARAKSRGSAIAARLPKYRGQVYTFSSAPNWYTRIGNFEKQEDAAKALAELKRMFPQFASDMRIVKSQIIIVK